jgi:hypothetical protein
MFIFLSVRYVPLHPVIKEVMFILRTSLKVCDFDSQLYKTTDNNYLLN